MTIFVSHVPAVNTHDSDHLFNDGLKTIYTKNVCTLQNTVIKTFPDFVFIFFLFTLIIYSFTL